MIDWVDFVEIGSTQYVAGPGSSVTLKASDLGPVYAHVKFKLSGNVRDPSYRPKDLMQHSWTPERLYQVAGQPTSEQLAARFNGSIVVYRGMAPVS